MSTSQPNATAKPSASEMEPRRQSVSLPGFAPAVPPKAQDSPILPGFGPAGPPNAEVAPNARAMSAPTAAGEEKKSAALAPSSTSTSNGTEEQPQEAAASAAGQPKSILRASRMVDKATKTTNKVKGWFTGDTKTSVKMPAKKPEAAAPAPAAAKPPPPPVPAPPPAAKPPSQAKSPRDSPTSAAIAAADAAATHSPLNSSKPGNDPLRRKKTAAKSVLTSPTAPLRKQPAQVMTNPSPARKKTVARKSNAEVKRKTTSAAAAAAEPPKKKAKAAASTAKKKTPTTSKATTPRSQTTAAKEVWSGVPDEDIGVDWKGWTKKTYERQSGKTKGSRDSYWFTPVKQYKLRSLNEVKRYVEGLNELGDEEKAWKRFKGKL